MFIKAGSGISRTNSDSQCTKNPVYGAIHRIGYVETNQSFGSNSDVICPRQNTASALAWLRETNAKRCHFIFPTNLL